MRSALGSRKRFLYRVTICAAAFALGLFVVLDNPDDVRGRVIGGLSILAGAAVLVMLITRLHDPWGAVRYAVRPVATLIDVLQRWDGQRPIHDVGLRAALRAHLSQQLPDVAIAVGDPADEGVLTLGDEILIVPDRRPETIEDRDGLLERIDMLRSPLESQAIVVVLTSDGHPNDEVDLSTLEGARGVHVVRV